MWVFFSLNILLYNNLKQFQIPNSETSNIVNFINTNN